MQGEGPGALGIFKIALDTKNRGPKMAQEAQGLGHIGAVRTPEFAF